MEELSNCCGAKIDGLNASGIGRCSECGEGCGVERVEFKEGEVKFSDLKGVIEGDETIEGFLDKLSEKKQ